MADTKDRQMDPKLVTAGKLVGIVLTMGALAWASVPFYNWFCRVTGYGGTTAVSDGTTKEILDRTILVRFDANTERGMPVRIGETGLAFYEATNPTDRVVAGSAAYNVAPYTAGGYFTKIDCFCFTEQVLQPGESVLMPVTFYVDPEIVEDEDAKHLNHITLSYTFYEIDVPERQAALSTDAPPATSSN
jgi:cytochrome c oxidase assembly protein subunit 11